MHLPFLSQKNAKPSYHDNTLLCTKSALLLNQKRIPVETDITIVWQMKSLWLSLSVLGN